jgi:hypothetical protein
LAKLFVERWPTQSGRIAATRDYRCFGFCFKGFLMGDHMRLKKNFASKCLRTHKYVVSSLYNLRRDLVLVGTGFEK